MPAFVAALGVPIRTASVNTDFSCSINYSKVVRQ